jgi:hypothetical protein
MSMSKDRIRDLHLHFSEIRTDYSHAGVLAAVLDREDQASLGGPGKALGLVQNNVYTGIQVAGILVLVHI